MSASVVNGSDLCLFITSGATKKCIALATSCKLGIAMATRQASSKDSGIWQESFPSRFNWTVDSENLFTQDTVTGSTTYDQLVDLMLLRTPITITVGQVTTSGMGYAQTLGSGKNLSGTAYITKIDLNAPTEDNSTFSISMEGTGALAHSV